MAVRRDDEHELVAALYGVSAGELRARADRLGQHVARWAVLDGARPVAAASTVRRPDDRTFLRLTRDHEAWGELTGAAIADIGAPLHVHVDEARRTDIGALTHAGFVGEASTEAFRVSFDALASWLGRTWAAPSFVIRSAADVDRDRLFELDNSIRRDVVGTDGWRGNRRWFDDEFEADEFDREAYLVAIAKRSGDYAGLIRFWRNPTGPRLGLLGVVPPCRRSTLAAALLQQGAAAAAGWGHDSFVTETSPEQHVLHPRLLRMGALSLGRTLQMVRPAAEQGQVAPSSRS